MLERVPACVLLRRWPHQFLVSIRACFRLCDYAVWSPIVVGLFEGEVSSLEQPLAGKRLRATECHDTRHAARWQMRWLRGVRHP